MAWETRANGGRYYTRSRRVNGRIVRVYVGCGRKGEIAAEHDAARQTEREVERAVIRTEQERAQAIDAALASLHQTTDTLTRGILLAAGFERYKRQWRTRREDPIDNPANDDGHTPPERPVRKHRQGRCR